MSFVHRQPVSIDMAFAASIAAVALSVFGTAYFGLILSQGFGGLAAIWPSDAVQMAILLRSDRRHWPIFVVVGLFASTMANLVAGTPFLVGLMLSACNTIGILPAAMVLRRVYDSSIDLSRRGDLVAFGLIAGIACPAISATPAAFFLHYLHGADVLITWRKWFLSVDLGMFAVAPALLTMLGHDRTDFFRWLHGAGRFKTIGLMLAVAIVAGCIFIQSSDQLLSLLFPTLLIAILDLGFAGAAIATFLVAMISIPLTIAGHGPFAQAESVDAGVLALQFFLTITVATTLPVAVVLAELGRSQDRLRRTTDQATRANTTKSAFLASMSHELRTPLNSVIGFAEVLLSAKDHPLPEKQRDYVELILKGGKQLLALVSDVLDFTDIEAGTVRLSIETVETQELLQEMAATMMPQAGARSVSIAVERPQRPLPVLLGDRTRLVQILTNLVSNGIKYNRPSGSVTLSAEPHEGEWVRIWVCDTGIGIPLARQHEVFQPFNRLGAEGGSIEGTGIGLTICQRLIVQMNGRIGFDSIPGGGSRFWILVPRAVKDEALWPGRG